MVNSQAAIVVVKKSCH